MSRRAVAAAVLASGSIACGACSPDAEPPRPVLLDTLHVGGVAVPITGSDRGLCAGVGATFDVACARAFLDSGDRIRWSELSADRVLPSGSRLLLIASKPGVPIRGVPLDSGIVEFEGIRHRITVGAVVGDTACLEYGRKPDTGTLGVHAVAATGAEADTSAAAEATVVGGADCGE